MIHVKRVSTRAVAVLASVIVTMQFMNCGTSDTSDFLGSSGTKLNLSPGSSSTYLNPKSDPPRMECIQDHIQIGGTCEVDGATDNYIEFSLTREKTPVPWTVDGKPETILKSARCDSGRYFILVPRPSDTVIAVNDTARCYSVGCWDEYKLHSRLFIRRPRTSQYDLAYTSPAINLAVQLIHQNGADRTCPQP